MLFLPLKLNLAWLGCQIESVTVNLFDATAINEMHFRKSSADLLVGCPGDVHVAGKLLKCA
jgi:hypothetical protein